MGCSSVGRASDSDRHVADAGSIPRCDKGFSSQSQLSVQTLLRCPCTPVRIYICPHVRDPVVHVRVRCIMETLKTPSTHRRLGSATLSHLAFPQGRQPEFPTGEFPLGQNSCKKCFLFFNNNNNKKKQKREKWLLLKN